MDNIITNVDGVKVRVYDFGDEVADRYTIAVSYTHLTLPTNSLV